MSPIRPSRRFQGLTISVAIGGIADIAGNDTGSTRSRLTHLCHGRYDAAIQLRRMLQFTAKGEENHEAAGIRCWSDVRGRNGTGAGTADWESLPDRIRSSHGPGCRSKSGEQRLPRNPRRFRGANTLRLCRRAQSPDRAIFRRRACSALS
jgi:hypothetical protein